MATGAPRLSGLVLGAMMLASAPLAAAHAQDEPFSPAQEQRIGELVREYLLAHPEVLVEAFDELQAREAEQSAARAQTALESRAADLFDTPSDPVGGNPDGGITVVEFFDYNCPYCRQVTATVDELLADDPDVRFVYKEFPILAPSSVFAAHAALAVWRTEPALYEAFHDALMSGSGRLSEDAVLDRAAAVGIDVERMQAAMDDPEIGRTIETNLSLAQVLEISGTPTFVIGRQILPGAQSLQALQAAVEAAQD